MSATNTGSRRNAAVPHEPARGPICGAVDRRRVRGRQARRRAVAQVPGSSRSRIEAIVSGLELLDEADDDCRGPRRAARRRRAARAPRARPACTRSARCCARAIRSLLGDVAAGPDAGRSACRRRRTTSPIVSSTRTVPSGRDDPLAVREAASALDRGLDLAAGCGRGPRGGARRGRRRT